MPNEQSPKPSKLRENANFVDISKKLEKLYAPTALQVNYNYLEDTSHTKSNTSVRAQKAQVTADSQKNDKNSLAALNEELKNKIQKQKANIENKVPSGSTDIARDIKQFTSPTKTTMPLSQVSKQVTQQTQSPLQAYDKLLKELKEWFQHSKLDPDDSLLPSNKQGTPSNNLSDSFQQKLNSIRKDVTTSGLYDSGFDGSDSDDQQLAYQNNDYSSDDSIEESELKTDAPQNEGEHTVPAAKPNDETTQPVAPQSDCSDKTIFSWLFLGFFANEAKSDKQIVSNYEQTANVNVEHTQTSQENVEATQQNLDPTQQNEENEPQQRTGWLSYLGLS